MASAPPVLRDLAAPEPEPAAGPAPFAPRRIAVVYNPRSGYWLKQGDEGPEQALARAAGRHGIAFEACPLGSDDLAATVRGVAATRPDAIFISGGDGTINGVVGALEGARIPLGIIPSGTMNLLARELGVPFEFDAAVAALVGAEPQAIDLGRVNGVPFLCHSMLGLMPHITRAREQERGAPGRWRLTPRVLRKALWLWRNYPRIGVELACADGTLRLLTRAITVSNNPLREGTAPIPMRTRLDRGVLGVYVLEDRSRWDIFRIGLKILAGTWHEDRDVIAYETARLTIDLGERRPLTVSNDGEAMQLEAPLVYTSEPGAVVVLVPRRAED